MANSSLPTMASLKMAAFNYWNESAYKNADAQALAARLNLDLPHGVTIGSKGGLKYPIRRLVVTGEDTPENFAILFGPDWKESMSDIHEQERTEVLMSPAPEVGSSAHMLSGYLDEGCPCWKPRAPSEEEEVKLRKFKEQVQHVQAMMAGIL